MNRGLRSVAIGLALFVAIPSGTAQETTVDEGERAKQTTVSLERKLAALLAELNRGMPSGTITPLDRVQRRWKAYAESDCRWERARFAGGSIAGLVYAECMRSHLERRIDRLKPLLCEGSGATGPCEASQRY